ncbi:hypothetical protein KEM54_000889 [Ascosphaera aggregata]|nr:hypothetical protein KEM54_000889 [Ascosphaera aggregata]
MLDMSSNHPIHSYQTHNSLLSLRTPSQSPSQPRFSNSHHTTDYIRHTSTTPASSSSSPSPSSQAPSSSSSAATASKDQQTFAETIDPSSLTLPLSLPSGNHRNFTRQPSLVDLGLGLDLNWWSSVYAAAPSAAPSTTEPAFFPPSLGDRTTTLESSKTPPTSQCRDEITSKVPTVISTDDEGRIEKVPDPLDYSCGVLNPHHNNQQRQQQQQQQHLLLPHGLAFGLDGTGDYATVTRRRDASTTHEKNTATVRSENTPHPQQQQQQRLASPFADRRRKASTQFIEGALTKISSKNDDTIDMVSLDAATDTSNPSSAPQHVRHENAITMKFQRNDTAASASAAAAAAAAASAAASVTLAESTLQTPPPSSSDSCRNMNGQSRPQTQRPGQSIIGMRDIKHAETSESATAAAAHDPDSGITRNDSDAQDLTTPRPKVLHSISATTIADTADANMNNPGIPPLHDPWTRYTSPEWEQSFRGMISGSGSFGMGMELSMVGTGLGLGLDDENYLRIDTPSKIMFQDGIGGMMLERTPHSLNLHGEGPEETTRARKMDDKGGSASKNFVGNDNGNKDNADNDDDAVGGDDTAGLQSSPIRLPKKKLFNENLGNEKPSSNSTSTATSDRQEHTDNLEKHGRSTSPATSSASGLAVSDLDSMPYDDPFKAFLSTMPTSLDVFSDPLCAVPAAHENAHTQVHFPCLTSYNYNANPHYRPSLSPTSVRQAMFMTPHAHTTPFFGSNDGVNPAILPATSPIPLPTSLPQNYRGNRYPQHYSYGRQHGNGIGCNQYNHYKHLPFQSHPAWMMNDDDPAMFLSSPARRIGNGYGYSPQSLR